MLASFPTSESKAHFFVSLPVAYTTFEACLGVRQHQLYDFVCPAVSSLSSSFYISPQENMDNSLVRGMHDLQALSSTGRPQGEHVHVVSLLNSKEFKLGTCKSCPCNRGVSCKHASCMNVVNSANRKTSQAIFKCPL